MCLTEPSSGMAVAIPSSGAAGCRRGRTARRGGLTLVELLLALAVVTFVGGSLGAMSLAVQRTAEFCETHGTATQHARVVLERIQRAVSGATANEQYPGVWVVEEFVGGWSFSEVLVVWRPDGPAANPNGAPLVRELQMFCPDPKAPHQLLERTFPGDDRWLPSADDTAALWSLFRSLRTSDNAQTVVLTELLRVAEVEPGVAASRRAALRFVVQLSPTAAMWGEFQDGVRGWPDLDWPLGIFGPKTGLRQVWLRTELQLASPRSLVAADAAGQTVVPYLGSATRYYEMRR
jgi:hypothetical protein